uniref:RING-type E3 ubiquitin transferase n=1 Tax=Caenorhabditis japonica TaxID=281687 RepID=A0A8R1E146_CAEJA
MRFLVQNPLNMPDDVPNVTNSEEGKKNAKSGGGRGRGGRGGGRGGQRPSNSSRPAHRPHATKVDMKKYERMINAAHTNFSDIPCGQNAMDCDICCKPNDVFGVGSCRHPICVECAIRMRVLGNSKTCPVCRADLEILSFCTTDVDFSTVQLSFAPSGHPDEPRFGIRFNSKVSGSKYEKYLAHVCKICKTDDGERLEFPSFMSLRQHMASRHEQSYCHICTDNLNLFSRERKTYTREQLQRHMKSGDFDDKSFKGHPQCLFCEQKFLDEENRYRHLRKEHFFCQFCESDGTMTNVFFGKHDELKKHYKENHFICEVDECKEMGIAFASKFELDLHCANEHSERRNLIELGFGQRPQPADARRPMGRGRGGRHNEPPPQVPRERIALVQRQVETNPQSDPSQFTTVRSAQSKSTVLTQRSAFTSSQQEFPSLAGNAPPPPPMRSSEFPRLNKVNKPSASSPSEQQQQPVEHFPSLGGSSSSSSAPLLRIKVPPLVKKRQPPPAPIPKPTPKAKPVPSRPRESREEDEDYIPRRDVPQAVIKVNNTKLRFDTVDDRVAPVVAKSNIQMVQRVDQRPTLASSSSTPSRGRMDFPELPAASAPMLPANSSWLNSKNSKIKSGVISSVTVPQNYAKTAQNQNKKKKKVPVPKTEVWSSLGPALGPATTSAPTDEWLDVPLSKEAQAEQEKLKRKEEWARKKAEIQARVAAASKDLKKEEVAVVESQPVTPSTPSSSSIVAEPDSEWQVASSKAFEELKAAEERKRERENKKKNKKKAEEPTPAPKKQQEVPKVSAPAAAPKPKPEPVTKSISQSQPKPKTQRAVPSEPPKEATSQEKMDALWSMPKLPSMTSMFSNFSISGMFGMSNASTPTSSGPPPGLENVVLTPPPGLELPPPPPQKENLSFAAAPMISHDDVKEKRERMEAQRRNEEVKKEDDGWTTTGNAKSNGKKNKNKK